MNHVGFPQFYEKTEDIRRKFLQALPVIVFFLLMFYSVILLFGIEYTMVVSLATLIFQVNYKKQHTASSLFVILLQQIFLMILSFIATWNIPLCLLFNLIVPFWLIFSKSSQFNQLGYFSGLMTFTFLQLMPIDWQRFLVQSEVMLFCCLFVFLAVLLSSKFRKKVSGGETERLCMGLLGQILEETVNKESIEAELSQLFELQRKLYQEAYQERGKKYVVTAAGKLKYMFAILIQRTAYFVSGQSQLLLPKDEEGKELALRLAEYMKNAAEIDFMGADTVEADTEKLKKEGRRLLAEAQKKKNDFYRSVTNFLRMYLLILHQAEQKDNGILSERWEVPTKQKFKDRILYRMKPDTFEMRFALRMSVVLMIGLTVNLLFDEGHSYWFAMNAFLLLRPMYEDSNYRMKTRFIGTAAGCILVSTLLPFCTDTLSHLIIAGIMVACMYTATPGTTIHALFVTCFALTMTTLAMGETTAALLRMAYVIAAVVFVLVINRFFFPTSMGSQLRYNFQMLFHMHHMYLRILEDCLTNPLDYWRLCDAQLQYHMVHAQIKQDLPKTAAQDEEYYLKVLSVTWRMASEIQQMFFHVTHKKRSAQARRVMEQYISYNDYVLNQIQEIQHLKKEKKLKNIEGMKYQRYIEGEPELSVLMTQYARNLSRLYILVLRRYR